jgi:hypothetical protein
VLPVDTPWGRRIPVRWPPLVVPRLGLALIGLALAAWLTGIPYLLVRLGLALPVALSRFDGPHIYLGIAMAALLLFKVAEIRTRHLLRTLPGFLLWHHWLSLALLGLWALVFVSGVLILVPWPATWRQDIVEVHVFASVWASIATLPHAVIYLRRRLPSARIDRRLVAAALTILVPGAIAGLVPRAAAPFSELDAGQSWATVQNLYAYRLEPLPDGRIVATGFGLRISDDGGFHWRSVGDLGDQFVYSLVTGPGGKPAYAGTTDGLLWAPDVDGPYRPLGLQSQSVDSVFVDPSSPSTIWAGGRGVWLSTDGGGTWTTPVDGMLQQGSVFVIGRYKGDLYAGTSTGLYRWDGAGWHMVLNQPAIISLEYGADTSTLWACSMGGGLYVDRGGTWVRSDSGMLVHKHPGGLDGIHVTAFLALDRHRSLAGTMTRGLAESLDGGSSWYSPSPGFSPGEIWDLLRVGDHVLVSSDTGIYVGRFPAPPSPEPLWWGVLVIMAVLAAAGGTAIGLAATPQRPNPPRS